LEKVSQLWPWTVQAGFPALRIFSLTTLLLLLHAAMPLFSFLSFTTLSFFSAAKKKC
jgi:hypothetical protein